MYQFSSACAQIERRVGEGAPSESFFLIKDSIEEDCGLARFVCRVSSIPPCSPPQGRGASLCLLFHLISRVHARVRSCPLMLHSMQYLLYRKALREPPCSRTKHRRKTTYDILLILIPTCAVRGGSPLLHTHKHSRCINLIKWPVLIDVFARRYLAMFCSFSCSSCLKNKIPSILSRLFICLTVTYMN